MPPLRLWSKGQKILGVVAVVAVVAIVVGLVLRYKPPLTMATVAVATLSLVISAISTWFSVVRGRRKDTIEAWAAWSDQHREGRRLLTRLWGEGPLNVEVSAALADDDAELRGGNGEVLGAAEASEVRTHVRASLNGLERLATGVGLSVYDQHVLQRIGATIIVRQYQRLEEYIKIIQAGTPREIAQRRAYVQLGTLVELLETPSIVSRLTGEPAEYDETRIRDLEEVPVDEADGDPLDSLPTGQTTQPDEP
ncbi:hypothetical protein A5670_02965 [Mycolicibacterium fortuitum]|nr:hypothetical protein A5670_02965 [Mycolicibacterium fortuitum]